MPESSPPRVHKLVSLSNFLKLPLLPAAILSLLAGGLLAVVIVAGGGLTLLLVARSGHWPDSPSAVISDAESNDQAADEGKQLPPAEPAIAQSVEQAAEAAEPGQVNELPPSGVGPPTAAGVGPPTAAGVNRTEVAGSAGAKLQNAAHGLKSADRWAEAVSGAMGRIPGFGRPQTAATILVCVVCVCLVLRWWLRSLADAISNRVAAAHVQRIRQHIHRKAIRLESADLVGDQVRETDRLFRETATQLEKSLADWAQRWLLHLPDLVAAVGIALVVDWRVALETMIPVVLCWFGLHQETQRSDATARLLAEQAERGLQRLSEGLRKTRIVNGFGMEKVESTQFETNLTQYRNRRVQLQRQREFRDWVHRMILLFAVLVPGFLLIRHMQSHGGLSVSSAVVIVACLAVMFRCLLGLQKTSALAGETVIRIEETGAYIDRVPLVSQIVGAGFSEPMSRSLQFNQVSYRTSQHPQLIDQLDLKILYGERVALVSLNPAMPAALAAMVPRFIDPDGGQVLIDGKDIRQATLESLRAEAIFVGGDDPVFNATVVENISCGQADISRQQVIDACKVVHADQFIRALPKGYETHLGEHGGVSLDIGQMFRISLARALVRKPALLIIAEPRCALDAETKAVLDDAYPRLSADCTVIFLPFRLSTVKRCDRVVMLHGGRVVADGSHDSLVRSHDLYRHWEYINFNEFREQRDTATAVNPG